MCVGVTHVVVPALRLESVLLIRASGTRCEAKRRRRDRVYLCSQRPPPPPTPLIVSGCRERERKPICIQTGMAHTLLLSVCICVHNVSRGEQTTAGSGLGTRAAAKGSTPRVYTPLVHPALVVLVCPTCSSANSDAHDCTRLHWALLSPPILHYVHLDPILSPNNPLHLLAGGRGFESAARVCMGVPSCSYPFFRSLHGHFIPRRWPARTCTHTFFFPHIGF